MTLFTINCNISLMPTTAMHTVQSLTLLLHSIPLILFNVAIVGCFYFAGLLMWSAWAGFMVVERAVVAAAAELDGVRRS